MRPLDLDYVRRSQRGAWTGWLLLVVAILFAAGLGRSYLAVSKGVAQAEDRLEGARRVTVRKPTVAERVVTGEQLSAAKGVVKRFAAPWPVLFKALEAVEVDSIALLSIEPDVESGAVTITGEAKDYLAVLTYVAHLRKQPGLARIHLAHHEIRTNEAQRPVGFTVSGVWRRS